MAQDNTRDALSVRKYKQVGPKIGLRVFIDPAAVIIGNVNLGDDSSVWPCAVIRGDAYHIHIGARTNVQDGSILHVSDPDEAASARGSLDIGDDVTIGHGVNLHGCTIGNRVLIGIGSIVLDNAIVEDDVIIGAGTLIPPNKVLKSGFLYTGNPFKEVRPLKETEKMLFVKSSQTYVNLKETLLKPQL